MQQLFTLEEAKSIIEQKRYGYEHQIITKIGVFSWQWHRGFNYQSDTEKQKYEYWICAKFGDPEKAIERFFCSTISGKRNCWGTLNKKKKYIITPLEELIGILRVLKQSDLLIK